MDIDITEFFNNARPSYYSASVAEIGNDAGKITWQNACDCEFTLLNTEDEKDAFRKLVSEFGAWTDEEISAWTDEELSALCIQIISGDMREAGLHAGMSDDEWREYEEGCQAGQFSSRIYGGPLCIDQYKNRVFFSLD